MLTLTLSAIADMPDDAVMLERLHVKVQKPSHDVGWNTVRHEASARSQIEGRIAERQRDVQRALESYLAAVEADPANGAAWSGLARLASRLGDAPLAARAWYHRLLCCPEDVQALEINATAAMLDDRPREAAAYLIRRRRCAPEETSKESAPWDILLAQALRQVGLAQEAGMYEREPLAVLRRHAAIDPGDGAHRAEWIYLLQALVDQRAYEVVRELAAIRRFQAMLPAPGDRGRFASVAITMDALLQDDQSSAELIEAMEENDVRLLESFRRPMDIAAAYAAAANIHATLGHRDGAERLYRKALIINPSNALALNNLGYAILERSGPTEEAASLIERAWAEVPEDAATLDSLGCLRLQQGRLADDANGLGAVTVLRRASRLANEQDPLILKHLGDALWASGDHIEGRRLWRLALGTLTHPDFMRNQMRIYSRVQSDDWGVSVMPARSLYDLEFGVMEDRLRADLMRRWSGQLPETD